MSLGDLLFVVALLAAAGTICRAFYSIARRRHDRARRVLHRLAMWAAVYLGALLLVSMLQPARFVALGAAQCFDEWCLVVDGATRRPVIGTTPAQGDFVIVAAHIENRGRGRAQREADVEASLRDDVGRRYSISARGTLALQRETGRRSSLRDSVDAGASREIDLVYEVPRAASRLAVVVGHSWFPHALIIGDPESLLHRRVLVPLP